MSSVTCAALAFAWTAAAEPPKASHLERAPAPRFRVGPVPDYGPLAGVRVNHGLKDLSPGLWYTLNSLLDEQMVVSFSEGVMAEIVDEDEPGSPDTGLIWMRDYSPVSVRRPDGSLGAVSYLSTNPRRAMWSPEDGPKPELMPLLHENGNLVRVGDHVFMTENILYDNQNTFSDPHLARAGFKMRRREEILETVSAHLGVARRHLHVVPPMPGEATGHIDLFMLPIEDDVVILPEIRLGALAIASRPMITAEIRDFLDARARALKALGIRVVRLPMMPPVIYSMEGEHVDDELGILSPANSLLVNHHGRKAVVVPTFDGVLREVRGWQDLSDAYVREWVKTFTAEGWVPYLVDASELVDLQGYFRCLTATIPE
ncbi:MAG: hypothetical protein ACE366_19485 [Bradymonadia bacterium]